MPATTSCASTREKPRALATASALGSPNEAGNNGTLGGNRTPNLLVRSQTLYPLSYEGTCSGRDYSGEHALTAVHCGH